MQDVFYTTGLATSCYSLLGLERFWPLIHMRVVLCWAFVAAVIATVIATTVSYCECRNCTDMQGVAADLELSTAHLLHIYCMS